MNGSCLVTMTDRHSDRHTDRQADIKTNRQTHRQTDRSDDQVATMTTLSHAPRLERLTA